MPVSASDSGWSKEALLSLLAILVMIILSSLSLAWKNGLLQKARSVRSKFWKTKNYDMARKFTETYSLNANKLLEAIDVECAACSCSGDTHTWVELKAARRHQQETYTSLLRMRGK